METPTKTLSLSQPEALKAPDAPKKRARTVSSEDKFIKVRYMKRYIYGEMDDDEEEPETRMSVEYTDVTCFLKVVVDDVDELPGRVRHTLDHMIDSGEMPMSIFKEIECKGFKTVTLRTYNNVTIWFVTKINE